MGNMDGTLDHCWNTIDLSNVMYRQPMSFKMLTHSSSLLPIFHCHISHYMIISISQQQTFLPSCKSNGKLYHHCNMAKKPKMHLSKQQNSQDQQPKNSLLFFQLQLQHLLCHISTSSFNIRGCQYHHSRLLYHLRGCLSYNQHHLRGYTRNLLHPNHCHPHLQFITSLIKKLKRKPKKKPHLMISNNYHSGQEY